MSDIGVAMRFFDDHAVAKSLPFPALIDHLTASLCRPAVAPLRLSISTDIAYELLVMPAVGDRFAGVKILSVVPANNNNCLPVIGGLFLLVDTKTGITVATMDASELTARRTAAVSALASRQLSRAESNSLLIIGTGHLAPYLAEAHATVRPIRSVQVWGRSFKNAEVTCAQIRNRLPKIDVSATSDLGTAIRTSDVISSATRAHEPIIKGALIAAGTHVDLVGGYRPDMREIDDVGIARATIYVDTLEGALAEAGDIRSPIDRGIISRAAIEGDITALLSGAGRTADDQVTLFKSVGSALSDLAAAELVWDTKCE